MSSAKDTKSKVLSSGLERQCPKCHASISLNDKFCGECGTTVGSGVASQKAGIAISGPLMFETTASYPSSSLQFKAAKTLPPPAADLLAHRRIPSRRLRELYFDLGIALADRHAYTEAIEALQHALEEMGDTDTGDILLYLAHVYELAGKNEHAVSNYLKATLQASKYIDAVLLYVHHLLTSGIALRLSTWVADEWKTDIESTPLTTLNRAHIALFIGHIQLYLANYNQAQEFFKEAVQLVPDVDPIWVNEILAPDILPPALTISSKDDNTHYTLAQLYYTLKSYEFALLEADQALDFGLVGENQYPQAPAMQLKAEVLWALDQREEAAQCFYEAGRYFYWSSEHRRAREQFSNAARLRPNHSQTYWFWADSLVMCTYAPELPDTRESLIKECLERWNTAFELSPPDVDFAWVYITRALLNEQRANIPNASQWALWWEAIVYLERAMLLGRQDVYIWSYLGRYHRFLSNESNALKATSRALEYEANEPVALEERVAILANVGKFREAEDRINERLVQEQNDWLYSVKAYIALYRGRDEESLKVLSDILEKDPDDIWTREIRASWYRVLDKPSLALEDYRVMWDRYKTLESGYVSVSDLLTYAWAAHSLNETDRAIEILNDIRDNPILDPGIANHYLGLCYLSQGKLALGRRYILKGIKQRINNRQLEDLNQDFADIEKASISWPHGVQVQRVLAQLRQVAKEQQIKLKHPRSVEDELKEVIGKYPRKGKNGKWGWVASQAGLARLYTEEKQWTKAARIYQLLLKEKKLFNEAHIGVEKVADGLQEEGDRYLSENDPQRALKRFTSALAFVPTSLPHDSLRQGNLYSRVGITYVSLSNPKNASTYFIKALQCYRQNNLPDPAIVVGKECRSLVRDVAHYWAVEAEWRVLVEGASVDEQLRSDLTTIWQSLSVYLDEVFKLSEQAAEDYGLIPVVTPIVLEIGEGLIPVDTSTADWVLFKSYIPEMRERILSEMGVNVPGVRVRGNDALSPDEYNILLDESLHTFKSSVPLGMRYSPNSPETLQAIGIPRQAFTEAPHPLTGAKGCWVSSDQYDLVTDHHLELWNEPLVFVIYHLEAVLRRNLANFLGMQELDDLLDRWKQDDDDSAYIASTLPDTRTKLYLTRILRTLVKEQVPIKQWRDILAVVQELALINADSREIIQAVRLRMKQSLPGNNPKLQRLELPFGWEDGLASGLRHENGRTFFSAPAEESLRLLAMISKHMPTLGGNAALVIRNAELRPFVQLLVESEFPYLMAIAEEEMLAPDELEMAHVEVNVTEENAVEVREKGVFTDAE